MKKNTKPPAQLEAERQEARQLATAIIALSNKVPDKIRNQADVYGVRAWKKHMTVALNAAKAKTLDVDKLRNAYNLVKGYYKGEPT